MKVFYMLTEAEQKVLEMLGKNHLVRRSELTGNGASFAAAMALIDKGFARVVCPLGETSFTITQKGIRFLNGSNI